MIYAHSLPGQSPDGWEPLLLHAEAVARRAADHAGAFGWAAVAEAAGRLHDIGKCSPAFQRYIRSEGAQAKGPNHSSAGAVEAVSRFPGFLGRLLAFVIAGHHAGLANGVDLDIRLGKNLPTDAGWEQHAGPMPDRAAHKGC